MLRKKNEKGEKKRKILLQNKREGVILTSHFEQINF